MFNSLSLKLGGVFAVLLLVFSMALTGAAEARMGGSFGSRGMRTFSSPSITTLAPNTTAPISRSMTPNTGTYSPGYNNGYGYQQPYNRGGFWSGLGGGILGGMLGGLFFHGLFGSMLGYGFGGVGGGFSLIFQLLLIGGLIWLALRWFRGSQPAGPRGFGNTSPFGGPAGGFGGSNGGFGGPGPGPSGFGGGSANRDEIGVTNRDLENFEQLLGEVQGAFAREDHQGLRRFTTPDMVSYLSEELADNAQKGVRNEVRDLKFINGELAEAWREGPKDYATVAMQWSAIDLLVDRQSGAVVKGDASTPVETVELWTFVRDNGGPWQLSAIQETRR